MLKHSTIGFKIKLILLIKFNSLLEIYQLFYFSYIYSENQKIVEKEDDIEEISRCIWYYTNANSFNIKFLNHLWKWNEFV